MSYYEAEQLELGQRFKNEVRKAVERISEYPKAWSIERREIRKCLLHKFPFKIMYLIEN